MMTEEKIEHWATIVSAVFKAEEAIKHEWLPKLRATKEAPKEERDKIADEYYRAIGREILSHASEAQLETNAASERIARYAAESKGWLIINKGDWLKERHYCPKCKEAL